jgi:hypothetical protein
LLRSRFHRSHFTSFTFFRITVVALALTPPHRTVRSITYSEGKGLSGQI